MSTPRRLVRHGAPRSASPAPATASTTAVIPDTASVPSVIAVPPLALQAVTPQDGPAASSTAYSEGNPTSRTERVTGSVIDREVFSSMNFSSPMFVNNITSRVVFPVLQRRRRQAQKLGGGGGHAIMNGSSTSNVGGAATGLTGDRSMAASSTSTSGGASLRGSDGTALFSSSYLPMQVRQVNEAVTGADTFDYVAIAATLTSTLEDADAAIARLLAEEEISLQRHEVRCKRVEIREKRQLAKIRLGLEATTARLQEYENRVSNAQAATAGIEQHLSQSNARVQRGRAVAQLLRFFTMFTAIAPAELAALLKSLSKARAEQRAAVTARWRRGRVAHFNPRFYTTTTATLLDTSGADARSTGSAQRAGNHAEADDLVVRDGRAQGRVRAVTRSASASSRPRGSRVLRRSRSLVGDARDGGVTQPQRGPDTPSTARPPPAPSRGDSAVADDRTTALAHPPVAADKDSGGVISDAEGNEASGADEDDGAESGNVDSGSATADVADGAQGRRVRMHRAEAAAVAAGLGRLFALRSATEAQVEWCQKLQLLAKELDTLVSNTRNIDLYVTWLRQELVADLFHLVTCFHTFYEANPQTAIHMSYGRALLTTLELVSRLYTTLTGNTDKLLSVFFSHTINEVAVTLFSEHSPPPLPAQPPLPQPTPLLAMTHYAEHTEKAFSAAFQFILQRLHRDTVLVETIFGAGNGAARQQLLMKVTEGVVRPFITQHIKLAATHRDSLVAAEATLSPRSRRRVSGRVADAIAFYYSVEVKLYELFQGYLRDLGTLFDPTEVEVLARFTETIFPDRADYAESRGELALLARYYTLIDEKYTRALHPVAEKFFDLREAHMTKARELLDRLREVVTRVRVYAPGRLVGPFVHDLIMAALRSMGDYLTTELRKTFDSLRADRDNWRERPASEEALLRPPRPESQQCGFRMLLFALSSLMSLADSVAALSLPLLKSYPRLVQDVEEARGRLLEPLDDQAERLLNMCAQAIVVRALSILIHYQHKNDFLPRQGKGEMGEAAPPCTRACTLFCYYVTRQFDEAREFIRLSNGQLPSRASASRPVATGRQAGALWLNYYGAELGRPTAAAATALPSSDGGYAVENNNNNSSSSTSSAGAAALSAATTFLHSARDASSTSLSRGLGAAAGGDYDAAQAVRARARTMNLQQLLYGDGGPSSLVRTLGVCLYRGIATHLKSFTVNDRGALVYKQDVTAYKEAMAPLTTTPGLGGAVVEVLFAMLKETSGLLIMPLDHIKEVKESGLLKLMSNEEKVRFIKIRQDVRAAFKAMNV